VDRQSPQWIPSKVTLGTKGSTGSSGLATTSLAFVTEFRVKRQISEFKVIYLFTFYINKGAFAVTSSENTEPNLYIIGYKILICQ